MVLVPMSVALGCASGGTTSPPPDAMAVDSCAQAGCDPAATCDDSTGVAVCACPEGYDDAAGNGTACTDIDECSTGLHECAPQASCSNRTGSYLCTCASGYAGDGFGCTDIDECAIGNHLCDADAGCENRDGSYACACNSGYSGDGFVCTDIDECATGAAGCDFYADCSNLPGSFECACRPGFMGDGFTCIDLDECALGIVTCTGTTVCENLPGSAACACANGYYDENGDASSCLTRGAGRVLLIGHDYSGISSPANALLGNAVLSANTTGTVDILFYTQYADKAPGEEVERSLAAVSERAAQLGRTLTTTELSDYTQLSALLPGKDVLLVLEQELATTTNMTTVGQAWALTLQTFVEGGGTVVVTDMSGSTWRILHYSGLMSISSTSTVSASTTLTVSEPQSPIGANLPATYGAPIGTRYYTSLDGLTLVNDPSGRAIVLMRSMFDECVVIDDFETGSWPSPLWAPSGTQLGTITALAAHDYNFGVRDPSWHYQTSVTAGRPGEKLSAYVRFQSLSGRAYLGLGASRGGTYSLVLAANLGVVSLQDNTDFGFEDLAISSFSFQTNVWYRAEIEYGTGTQASARLFVGTGSVAVVTMNLFVPGLAPGGAAIRGFGGVDIDTVKVCPGS